MPWTEPTDSSREVKDRAPGTEGMELQMVMGTLYPYVIETEDWALQMDIVRGLVLRDDDIISIGMPRSGNHWTFEVVSMILNQRAEYDADHLNNHFIEYVGPKVQETIETFKSPRYMFMHSRVTKVPAEVLQKGVKVLYVFRNPKDVWVSEFLYFSNHPEPRRRFTGTWVEFFQCQLDNKFIFGSWFDHVLAMEDFMERHPEHPVYVLLFERMKENPRAVVRELCQFLDRPDTLVDDIVQAIAFKTMGPALISGKMADLERDLRKQSNTEGEKPDDEMGKNFLLRKGVIGDWKNWFTKAQNEAFKKLFKEKMPTDSRLAKMVMPYMAL